MKINLVYYFLFFQFLNNKLDLNHLSGIVIEDYIFLPTNNDKINITTKVLRFLPSIPKLIPFLLILALYTI